jgi:uncharacterized protein (TIGR02186 family)
MVRLAVLLVLLALPLRAEEVVAGLSQNRVAINTNFDGSEILVFGAIKRDGPIPEGDLHVIVTVSGPFEPVVVRLKAREMGIWVNSEAVVVDHAPSFYAVATSAPWSEVISDTEDLRHKISIGRAIRSVGVDVADALSFTEALIRVRLRNGLYQTRLESVKVTDATLFNMQIALPSNLTEGNYTVRFFLTREREVIDVSSTTIFVRKVGLERFLFNLAYEWPLAYGVFAIVIAISAGWGASAAFQYLRS